MEIVIFKKGLFQNLDTYLVPRIFWGYVILPFTLLAETLYIYHCGIHNWSSAQICWTTSYKVDDVTWSRIFSRRVHLIIKFTVAEFCGTEAIYMCIKDIWAQNKKWY
jgi:hypothetical protein